jgi:hypothetical protein
MPRAKSGSLGIRGGKGKMLARRGRKKKKVVAKKGRTAAEQRAAVARGVSKVRGGDGPKLIPEGGTPVNTAPAAVTPARKPTDVASKSITRTLANRGVKNIRRPGSDKPTESPSILGGLGQTVGDLFKGWDHERGLRPDRKPVQGHASGGPVRGVGKAIRGHGRGKIV